MTREVPALGDAVRVRLFARRVAEFAVLRYLALRFFTLPTLFFSFGASGGF